MPKRRGKTVTLVAVVAGSAVLLYWAKDHVREEYLLRRFPEADPEHRVEIGRELVELGSVRAVVLFLEEYDRDPSDAQELVYMAREIVQAKHVKALPYVVQALEGTAFYGRIYCLRFLEMEGPLAKEAAPQVACLLETSPHGPIRLLALHTLGAISAGSDVTRAALVTSLQDPVEGVRSYAATALLNAGDAREGAMAVLRRIARDPRSSYRRSADAALAGAGLEEPRASR